MVANRESSVSVTAPTTGSLEEVERFIRTNLIRFGTDIQVETRKNGDCTLRFKGSGSPFLKDGEVWEYPYQLILIHFPKVNIEIHYFVEGKKRTTIFGNGSLGGEDKVVKIRPSDLHDLWQCPRCFYLRYNHNLKQLPLSVPGGIPGIASTLANKEEGIMWRRKTADWCPQINPSGKFKWQGGTLASNPLPLEGRNTYYIGGKFDLLAELSDGTFAVVDCKTTLKKDRKELTDRFSYQLQAYAYCLENLPDNDFTKKLKFLKNRIHLLPTLPPQKRKVSHLGLLCFDIKSGQINATPQGTTFSADVFYVPIKNDSKALLEKAQAVADLLEQDSPPEASAGCDSCNLLEEINSFRWNGISRDKS